MWTCPRCGRSFANRNQPHAYGPLDLARRLEHPRFRRVESFSPRNHLHLFRLARLEEADEEVAAWLAEAYRVGEQRHLGR